MYLKQIEITGFKSFADKTRLTFEPGMIAIVGPNGCGKSNVSDAIRWVLGEQRPTALRCTKMVDVLFNGTDKRKALGMAEVSITFADCEGLLDTAFHEVTVTRRVFRSGEGQYFINKTPSRLKDVQRLFMGTGIGTTSYSVMAQGQIDAILSSKPEDRRAVFEEAAGITKFKADRKEALRKIEQTETNLLREADVLREMKRQIGTLQRQVGKAQKYKELRDELRGLDIFVSRRRIADYDVKLRGLDDATQALVARIAEHQDAVAEAEAESAKIHAQIHATEERIATLAEQGATADNQLIRAQEVIKVNEQRIVEYRQWAERDNREITETQAQIAQLTLQRESLQQKKRLLLESLESEQAKLDIAQEKFDEHRAQIEATRAAAQEARATSVACERRTAEIQNQLGEMEAKQRDAIMKRERLSAEQRQMRETLEAAATVRDEVQARRAALHAESESAQARFEALEAERATVTADVRVMQEKLATTQSEAAAKRAQFDLLTEQHASADDFAAGTQQLLDMKNPLALPADAVLGPLADKFNAPAAMRLPLEAALRVWLDAVVVRDAAAARQAVHALLAQEKHGAARIVIAQSDAPVVCATPSGTTPLLEHVTVADDFAEAAARLLGNVFLADSAEDFPESIPAGAVIVTRRGVVCHATGAVDVWMPESQTSSPLARRILMAETSEQLKTLTTQITENRVRVENAVARSNALAEEIRLTRQGLDDCRRNAAQADGEFQSVQRDAERAEARLSAVSTELESVTRETAGDDETRTALSDELAELIYQRNEVIEKSTTLATRLQDLESIYSELSQTLTECRIHVSSMQQQMEYSVTQEEDVCTRSTELTRTLEGRASGVRSYDESIARLEGEIESLTTNLEPMRLMAEELHQKMDDARAERMRAQGTLEHTDALLAECRRALDAVREDKAHIEVEAAEAKMLRQNQLDHIFNEYGLSPEELVAEADPAWPKGQPPPIEEIAARVGQLTTAIQALGPVNMVAIEEYRELEERYAREKAQEEDLLAAKEQILQLIQTLNTKSSELFQQTFQQASANFEAMFTKLFNGGQAKLVLLENAEDPLECGIDIIARPPGKRPQSVTLLSGGERTMTAVSLLFAIFMIKPAPFCLLDELDAALDDSNIGRFVQALKDFLTHSQFLIITHNQHTIAGSDLVYGVTQQEKGISRIVSMRLKEVGVTELPGGAAVTDADAPNVTVAQEPQEGDGEAPKKTRGKRKPRTT